MIRSVEALNYRCLRYIQQELDRFQLLVGPNASGKTTFLDVIDFLGDIVSGGLDEAINKRTQSFFDLIWGRDPEGFFELAVELEISEEIRNKLENREHTIARYELRLGVDKPSGEFIIESEKLCLKEDQGYHKRRPAEQYSFFPCEHVIPESIITDTRSAGKKTVINKVHESKYNFYYETGGGGKGWGYSFNIHQRKSGLGNLPEDYTKFPASSWVKKILTDGIQRLMLNSVAMRKPSPPGQPIGFLPDGTNLPWVINNLREKHPERHKEWVKHIKTALPDINDVDTIIRDEDRHRYIMLKYENGLKIPSWTASDGTLRLLALTLLAYMTEQNGIYLIEEPENGIHPKDQETVLQSLMSVYDGQVLVATHSPVLVAHADIDNILCFAKNAKGATDIVRGDEHPKLKNWQNTISLGEYFAAGVLG